MNARANRGSGGVGILVKDEVFAHFSIEILDKGTEGILWLYLKSLHDDTSFCLAVCYLPPMTLLNPPKQMYISTAYCSTYTCIRTRVKWSSWGT